MANEEIYRPYEHLYVDELLPAGVYTLPGLPISMELKATNGEGYEAKAMSTELYGFIARIEAEVRQRFGSDLKEIVVTIPLA